MDGPNKKRQYSRKGCLECKRRKIKCDELQPLCGHCQKIEHQCEYPDASAPKKPRKPRTVRTKPRFKIIDNNEISKLTSTKPIKKKSVPPKPPQDITPDLGDGLLSLDTMLDDANSLVHSLADFDIFDMTPGKPSSSLKPFHSNIILNNSTSVPFEDNELDSYLHDNSPKLLQSDVDMSSFFNMNTQVPKSNLELVNQVIATHKLAEPETTYLKEITYTDLLFYIYPYGSSVENDQIIRILLEYMLGFKYLLYAVIALSASCSYTKTYDVLHERNQKKYTTICMRLLVGAFGDLNNNKHYLLDIEGLVLTVIVLAMIFADVAYLDYSKVSDSWTSHLNGARDLIIKYNKVKLQDTGKDLIDSPGITLAKLLFYNYDYISKMNLSAEDLSNIDIGNVSVFMFTGTFTNAINPSFYDALNKLSLLTPATSTLSPFNLFSTMTQEVAYALEEFIMLLQKTKLDCKSGDYRQVSPFEIMKVMQLLQNAASQEIVPYIGLSPNFIIPETSAAHPSYPDSSTKIYLPTEAYIVDYNSNGKPIYYSACDASQQLHVLYIYMKILTTPGLMYLPRRHPMIQETIRKIMGLMFFLKPKADANYKPENVLVESENYYLSKNLFTYKAIMNQLTFRICSDLVDDLDDFERLELYFEGLLKMSNGSAVVALDKHRKNRTLAIERNQKRAAGISDPSNLFDESDHAYSVDAYPVY